MKANSNCNCQFITSLISEQMSLAIFLKERVSLKGLQAKGMSKVPTNIFVCGARILHQQGQEFIITYSRAGCHLPYTSYGQLCRHQSTSFGVLKEYIAASINMLTLQRP